MEAKKRSLLSNKSEMAEVSRLIRIMNHCVGRLILILPPHLGPMNRICIDIMAIYGLFKGVSVLLRIDGKKHRHARSADFVNEGTKENLNLTRPPDE